MRTIVFDIETKNIFQDVGAHDPVLLDIAVVALHDSETDTYSSYIESEFPKMWPIFEKADLLVGYNSDHFDIPLLNKYYPGDLTQIKSVDIMVAIKNALGRRLGLGNVAGATLGLKKSADGMQAYYWWKEGKVQEIRDYCVQDVKVTKNLYEYILKNKKIMYRDGPNMLPLSLDITDWEKESNHSLTHSFGF
ncbi:MAG: ribonuclease H-like domain-containing protein [Patescibacteria group bacterium]